MGTAVLVISHKITAHKAAEDFRAMILRAGSRVPECRTAAAMLDQDYVSLQAAVASLLGAQDIARLLVIPYFLHNAGHASRDIPEFVKMVMAQYPGVEVEILPGMWNEPLLEDALFERIASAVTEAKDLPQTGAEIEKNSHEIIDRRLVYTSFSREEKIVARRIIHATADFSFAETLRFHPQAVARGVAALRARKPVICDVNMLKSGITRTSGSEIHCAISAPEVIEAAKQKNCTRAAAAMEHLQPLLEGAIIAIGNAPTAIWKLLQLPVNPALVIGLPVGLVGARESKQALIASSFVSIANTTPRGGSPAAAAAVNALALLAREPA